ncbi:MAG: 4-hydroxy-tetrahydrodipicolinate synthase [Lysobacterales bacterium]
MDSHRFSGSIVAIVTPLDAAGQVDSPALRNLINRQIVGGTSGIVIAGTTGEGAALSVPMLETALKVARETLKGSSLSLIVGIGSPATAKCLEQIERAQDGGAQALLCVTPYYLKTTQQGLASHFQALADKAQLPIILYNVPARTAVDLEAETTICLSQHPNIVGIKEALGDMSRVDALVQGTSNDFVVLSGDDATAREAMSHGANGVISVTANVVPAAMAELVKQALSGQNTQAKAMNDLLAPLHEALMSEPNPIPVKAALNGLGLIQPHLALPLVPACTDTLAVLKDLLDNSLAQWTGT